MHITKGRSAVLSTKGIVTSTQPLASQAGVLTLSRGGNCCDAAIGVAACLSVLEPSSTGPGGDFFALVYKDGKVMGLNGSGKSAGGLTVKVLKGDDVDGLGKKISTGSVHSVTIPGAVAGWIDLIDIYGSNNLTLLEILQPAIDLARNGFPVSKISSSMWQKGEKYLERQNPGDGCRFIPAPSEGEIRKLPGLADLFEILGQNGKDAFYNGPITWAILETTMPRGSKLNESDFINHASLQTLPITAEFRGFTVHEHGPNSQGIVALMVLKMIEIMEFRGQIPVLETITHNSVEYIHIIVECLKLGFGDAIWYVTDPEICDKTITDRLLSTEYLTTRCESVKMTKATCQTVPQPSPHSKSDTVMFAVTDSSGSSISVVNSLYTPFGSGIVVPKYDLLLQSRGSNFTLFPEAPNILAPSKRPFHTIIPGMVTKGTDLVYTFGNMGGFMQPQGHVQLLCNLMVFGMDVQEAVDSPRVCIDLQNGELLLEEGISEEVKTGLRDLGHNIGFVVDEMVFGRAQVIERRGKVNLAGSDRRGDGHACPQI